MHARPHLQLSQIAGCRAVGTQGDCRQQREAGGTQRCQRAVSGGGRVQLTPGGYECHAEDVIDRTAGAQQAATHALTGAPDAKQQDVGQVSEAEALWSK